MADESGMVISDVRESMQKVSEHVKAELHKVRTGRASAALLDGIHVDAYGSSTPLKQLANFAVPDPRMIVISPYDRGVISNIEKSILASNIGISPTNDGKVIRLAVPPLTEERRKDLVKKVKKIAEEHKVRVRDARRDALALIKEMETSGDLPKDDRHRCEKQIQDITDEFNSKIDEIAAQKEKEVLQV